MQKFLGITIAIIFGVNLMVTGLPVDSQAAEILSEDDNSTNHTGKQLYVIKATTYEVSFLVDVPNDDKTTENGTVTRDQVDVSFYGAESNDSFVNLGDVPLPIKSSDASGQIGISTVHIGSVQNVADILKKLPFSAQIQNITESGTSFVTINRENVTEAEQEIQLSDDADLSKLPILNNLLLPDSFETNTIAD